MMVRSSIENGISVLATSGCGPTDVAHQVVAIERDVERAAVLDFEGGVGVAPPGGRLDFVRDSRERA